ncbi:MAG TPA: transposase [Candidatus Paceibacterota bacterium]|jgi:putative transposase|nr:transposase [Candidatus Paceibacterota bacterium]
MLRKDPFITGEYYHLYNRGIDKRIIFKSKYDFERFIMLIYISNSQEEFKLNNLINQQKKSFFEVMILDKGKPLVSIGAWCLMANHFHILVRQEIDSGITKFMKKLGTGYSMFFNIKYQRQGALFGGPFKSKCIKTDDNYMRQLFAYIHLNVFDIKFSGWEKQDKNKNVDNKAMKDFLESYNYSSYFDYLGLDRVEGNILNKVAFPDYFQLKQSFQKFVENYFTSVS